LDLVWKKQLSSTSICIVEKKVEARHIGFFGGTSLGEKGNLVSLFFFDIIC